MKKAFFPVIAMGIIMMWGKLARAEDQSGHHQMLQMPMDEGKAADSGGQSTSEKAVDAGNKICPVTGVKINEKIKATVEYEGKIYNFCCAMCIDEFKKDPQKYIKIVEEELRAEPK